MKQDMPRRAYDTAVNCAQTAETIKMPLGLWVRVGSRNHVLDRGPDAPHANEHFLGKQHADDTRGLCKMAEPIRMPFGLWTRVGPWNHVWHGARWRHIANTTEPSVCGGDAALRQITSTTCSNACYGIKNIYVRIKLCMTRMRVNAQRDGRPTEYRWRPLFNAAKFAWRPLPECRAVTLPRRETRWN